MSAQQQQERPDELETCLADGLESAIGRDRLAEIGYRSWEDFESPAVQEWLLESFPPSDEVLEFVAVLIECTSPEVWNEQILTDLRLEPGEGTDCLVEQITADEDLRLVFIFGTRDGEEVLPGLADAAVDALAKIAELKQSCGVDQ